eukprot:5345889-Pyramimonas_sp.AAC.1
MLGRSWGALVRSRGRLGPLLGPSRGFSWAFLEPPFGLRVPPQGWAGACAAKREERGGRREEEG